MTQEEKRLEAARTHEAHWRRWGPYLSERQWGTVREDYSSNGAACYSQKMKLTSKDYLEIVTIQLMSKMA